MVEKKLCISCAVFLLEDRRFFTLTLDSIVKQTKATFEVLIISTHFSEKERALLSQYTTLPYVLHELQQDHLGKMMNLAVEKAKGEYIQFFFPGDQYLWRGALQEITSILRKGQFDLFFSSEVVRNDHFPSTVSAGDSFQSLKTGNMHVHLHTIVFATRLFTRFFRFDERIKCHAGFDYLIKIAQEKEIRIYLAKKVYVDQEIEKATRQETMRGIWERFFIIRRHFGILRGLFFFTHLLRKLIATCVRKTKAMFGGY